MQKLDILSSLGSCGDNQPVFTEEVQAWASGPVIKELYEALNGTFKVSVDIIDGNSDVLTENQKETIDVCVNFILRKNLKS